MTAWPFDEADGGCGGARQAGGHVVAVALLGIG
jgi:hypothetical protein